MNKRYTAYRLLSVSRMSLSAGLIAGLFLGGVIGVLAAIAVLHVWF